MMRYGIPNPGYYKPDIDLSLFASKNREAYTVGDYGKKMKLTAGINWINGEDFCAALSFPADDYYWYNHVEIFTNKNPNLYPLKRHICEYDFTLHAPNKKLEEFMQELGIKECQR